MADPQRQDTSNSSTQQAAERKTYYSFGDNGLTATAAATGGLLQMTRFFPGANYKTGFCVDTPSIDHPFLVTDRATELYFRASDLYPEYIEPLWETDETVDDDDFQTPQFIHDRWPHFVYKTPDGMVSTTQLLVSGNTIFQISEFESSTVLFNGIFPKIRVNADLIIRDLDFVTAPDNRGISETAETTYKTLIPDHGNFMMRSRQIDKADDIAIALFISVLSNSQSVRFEQSNDEVLLIPSDESLTLFKTGGKFTIVLAFTLKLQASQNLPSTAPVSFQDFESAMEQLKPEQYEEQTFTVDSHLNFSLRRNLEHILSVCSIPISTSGDHGHPTIALTCGDLDGHRVATSASFYSFQFLLLALKYFNRKHAEQDCQCQSPTGSLSRLAYVCRMRSRIKSTCEGHLRWVFERAARPKGLFAPNYWVNGDEITGWEKNAFLPGKSLVNTPFQIIKAGDFFKEFGDLPFPKERVHDVVDAWVKDLDKNNKLGLYAFARHREAPFQTFYFTDRALIWWALKCAEDIRPQFRLRVPFEDIGKRSARMRQEDRQRTKQYQKPRLYSSSVVQQHILKRFTIENPLAQKRMIALSRSPAHNRFLLCTKDTLLFRVMDLGLFDTNGNSNMSGTWGDKADTWRRTIDCQMHHEGNDDSKWQEPLRFAISIIMTHYGKRMNSRSAENGRSHAISTLLQSSSPNGLFPGAMDEIQEPIFYDNELMRDTYWSTIFEIPYILWRYGCGNSTILTEETHSPKDTLNGGDMLLRVQTSPMDSHDIMEQHISGIGPYQSKFLMKRTLPFNNVVYQENIVELSDEWLYNRPSFFVGEKGSGETQPDSEVAAAQTEVPNSHSLPKPEASSNQEQLAMSNHGNGAVASWVQSINRFLRRAPTASPKTSTSDTAVDQNGCPETAGVVVDVPRSHRRRKDSTMALYRLLRDKKDVEKCMEEGRNPDDSKKRLWWFLSRDTRGSGICRDTFCIKSPHAATSPLLTTKGLNAFIERHQSYGKFFFEDTVAVLNTWLTELHLSYYTLAPIETSSGEHMQDQRNMQPLEFPAHGTSGPGRSLSRIAMSFHFEGDFFDRYWTCRYLQADPHADMTQIEYSSANPDIKSWLQELFWGGKASSEADRVKAPWRQRRVLELRLFDRIITQMHAGAEEILAEAKSLFPEGHVDGSNELVEEETEKVHYRAFVNTSKRFKNVQRVLQVVEGDIAENLAKIELWQNREMERQMERPRWTFNDESRYRSVISKQSVFNDHTIQDLARTHSKIANYIDLLSKSLELMRMSLEQRRADDIQRFTYVTVVFLPLGFATGVYSMSDLPSNRTLYSMVATAVAALLAKAPDPKSVSRKGIRAGKFNDEG
ncbi:hypothetical protein ACHAPQ_009629 [Fusarium lateritium]